MRPRQHSACPRTLPGGMGSGFPTTRVEGRELDLADDSLVASIQGSHTEVKTRESRGLPGVRTGEDPSSPPGLWRGSGCF